MIWFEKQCEVDQVAPAKRFGRFEIRFTRDSLLLLSDDDEADSPLSMGLVNPQPIAEHIVNHGNHRSGVSSTFLHSIIPPSYHNICFLIQPRSTSSLNHIKFPSNRQQKPHLLERTTRSAHTFSHRQHPRSQTSDFCTKLWRSIQPFVPNVTNGTDFELS